MENHQYSDSRIWEVCRYLLCSKFSYQTYRIRSTTCSPPLPPLIQASACQILPEPHYPHVNLLIYQYDKPLEKGHHIFIFSRGYGRITNVVGLEVPNRLRITVAFPVGELGTCYQQFWAPTHQMQEIEEPREQVLHILDDAPPTYAKKSAIHSSSLLLRTTCHNQTTP